MRTTLPRRDGAFDESDDRGLSRRQILRAGAWAAPIIVLATAAPAAANVGSGVDPEPASPAGGNVLISSVSGRIGASNLNDNGRGGPLTGNGQINFSGNNSAPYVYYTVDLRTPGASAWTTLQSGVVNLTGSLPWYGQYPFNWAYGSPGMAKGTYQVRLMVTGSDMTEQKALASITV